MSTQFEHLLVDSIPFKVDSPLFFRHLQGAHSLVNFGVSNPEELVRILEDQRADVEIRKYASSFAVWLKYKPAVKSLIRIVLNDNDDVGVRHAAMVDLAVLGRTRGYKVLRQLALNDLTPTVRTSAISAICVSPNRYAARLMREIVLNDKSDEVRAFALRSLFSIPRVNKRSVCNLLMGIANSESEVPVIRAYAIEGLGYLYDNRALNLVITEINNPFPGIRYMCVYALGRLGTSLHLPLLESRINDKEVFNDWGTVAGATKAAIREIGQK